jgi:DNA-binding CsgD family transcriptional regulator
MPDAIPAARFSAIVETHMDPTASAGSLLGRERELAQIHELLETARTGPAALVLEGEPGIGKTTLWHAGTAAAREQGWVVVEARPTEAERDLSFSGLLDLLAPALVHLEALSPPRRRALEAALLLAADGPTAPEPRAVGLATLDVLRRLAKDGPLLVAVDDVHWLDSPSHQALAYAVRRLKREPVALLTAHRTGQEERSLGEPARVALRPLTIAALHELILARTGSATSRPTLVRIHETSGGNPFFALELVRALAGRELLPGKPLPVPASLGALTASRFDGLAPAARKVLLYVAALARPTVEVVAAAAGRPTARALRAAEIAGLVEADDSRLRFTHPLLASVHYGSASPDERARIHRRLAEVVTDAEERGRHLGAAADAPDAGVATALDTAAAAARARAAPASAAELAELALRLTPEDDAASLLRRRRVAADHELAAGSTLRARALLEQALADAPRGRARARVALQLAELFDVQDVAAQRPHLMRALHEAEGDPALRAEIHLDLSGHYSGVDVGESRRHAHLALGLAERAGDERLVTESLTEVSFADFWAGAGVDQALVERGIALEKRVSGLALLRRPSVCLAFALKWSGELDRAAPLWERLRVLARTEGEVDLMHILFFSAFHELLAEDWAQAERFADEAWALAVDAERDVAVAMYLWARAAIAAYRGQEDRVRAFAEEAHRIAVDVNLSDLLFSGIALGVLEVSLNDPPAALAQLRPATAQKLAAGIREPSLLRGFPEHIEAAIGAGELDEAAELLELVEEHARRLDRASALACCARGRALLAAARGEEAAAEAAFADAYEQHARRLQILPTYELARTLLLHGTMLRRRQRKREARAALEQALAIFERLGASLYTESTRSELARIGGRPAAAGADLTETERLIADLVAQGRSNKEVAAALSLSPKTVEWNLSKVYAKLGVRSRTELARRRP